MKAFLHERLQACLLLQRDVSDLIVRFNAGQFGVTEALLGFLDCAAQSFATHGLSSTEARVLELKAQLLMAERGIDPLTLLRGSGHRRELSSRFAFRVLMAMSEQLRENLQQDDAVLVAARQQLSPILLAGIQNGLAASTGLDIDAPSQAAISTFWSAALVHVNLGIAAKQVALLVILPDIVLLLWDLVAALSAAPVTLHTHQRAEHGAMMSSSAR